MWLAVPGRELVLVPTPGPGEGYLSFISWPADHVVLIRACGVKFKV